ncbi:MAG: hypothetical protein QOH89_2545 [Pseudonocardiales bacterium]|nr:hypothetical protein [Pseudonocardiales bacterium]
MRITRTRHLLRLAGAGAIVAGLLIVPTIASAHIERPSYWPLPGPDCSITPCAGGVVPHARTLASAVVASANSTTRVVCQPDSMTRLQDSITHALAHGYDIRPADHRTLTQTQANQLLAINQTLLGMCQYHQIQPAVTDSGNNDRVVIMPGLYTEPTARAQLTNDPACAQYKITGNTGGDISGAVTYDYQVHCPNDQNLIAVIGRALGSGQDPHPPLVDRHGIPNAGACIRCNLQIEGSGVSADDVIIDAGNPFSGNGPPLDSVKDVGIRADRADGFVLRNVTVRHAREHGIYVIETDGYLLEQFKAFWNKDYGVLTFVGDHGLMQNCEAAGSGDSGLYPGAGAKTGAGRDVHFYPTSRYSQEIRFCDSHHNLAGYSGTDGNATHVDHNNFYDNALGFTTDVFTAAGHPGFPQQGDLVEYNNFFDNNFNPYLPGSQIAPKQPLPVGTGMWIAGGNDNVVRYNRFWNNWRRGMMLFAVPDATVCGPGPLASNPPVDGCNPLKFSTSYRNKIYGNTMGIAPNGTRSRNGVDFWWDSFPTNTGNCWTNNHAAPFKRVTTSPPLLPNCVLLPSIGVGSTNEAELLVCFASTTVAEYDPTLCPWFTTPAKPPANGILGIPEPNLLGVPGLIDAVCALYGDAPNKLCS